jgi:hypothetical protein
LYWLPTTNIRIMVETFRKCFFHVFNNLLFNRHLPFDLDLTTLLETFSPTILQTFQASFKDHLTFHSLNCILSTRVSCWPKIWILMNLSATLVLYTLSISSKVHKLSIIYMLFDPIYKRVALSDRCFSLSHA